MDCPRLAGHRRDGQLTRSAFALVGRSYLALWSGDLNVASKNAHEAVEMGQRLKLDVVLSNAKLGYGTTLVNQGKDKEAYPHLVDAVELFDDQDQSWAKGATLVHLGNVALGLGQASEAISWLDMAMPLLNASGDVWNMAFGLNNYGEVTAFREIMRRRKNTTCGPSSCTNRRMPKGTRLV